jgi:hypothetical protein
MAVKISTFTAQTDGATGLATIDIKIPGTFTTINIADASWSGRQLLRAGLWLESRAAGDKIIAAYVNDSGGKIPVQIQGLFSSYPVLRNLHDDGADSANQGLVLPPNGPFQIDFPANAAARLASELHLIVVFKKATPSVDTAVINIAMDDGT